MWFMFVGDNTYKDYIHNDFTYGINKCDNTYTFLFTVISIVTDK